MVRLKLILALYLVLHAPSLPLIGGAESSTSLTLYDGRQFKNARIIEIKEHEVTLAHTGGVIAVSVDQVPLDILARAHEPIAARQQARAKYASEVQEREKARFSNTPAGAGAGQSAILKAIRPGQAALVATGGDGPTQLLENACVVMSNAGGTGTGFILRQKDGFVLLSNQHVIDGGAPHRIEMADGKTLKPFAGILAKDRDIVVFELAEDFSSYFEMEPDLTKVALGEDVVVYGNSLGRGVRQSHAKLVAKSASQLEISGGIVSGNSGGPIIRKKTGKVIGVSTFVTVRTSTPRTIRDIVAAATLPKVQYYGVRIDTLTAVSAFDLRRFLSEVEILKAEEARLRRGMTLLVFAAQWLGERPSSEMAALLKGADREVMRAAESLQYSKFYPGTIDTVQLGHFRRQADAFFHPVSATSSFIHAERREYLMEFRNRLLSVYGELLAKMPVK